MTTYFCSKCGLEKDENDFHKRKDRPKGRASLCKDCSCKRWRDFRDANPEIIKQNFKNWVGRPGNKDRLKLLWQKRDKAIRKELGTFLQELKESKPCTDCNVSYPYYVMDFDHLDPKEKSFAVSKIERAKTVERLLQEVAKCDLVCSNCHRVRTHNRGYARITNTT